VTGNLMPGTQTGDSQQKQVGTVASLVTGLEERLKANPGDGKGWLLLAKSYEHLGRPQDAREAYRKAVGLGETDPALDARLSTAIAQSVTSPAAKSVGGHVSLAEPLRGTVAPSDTVFIIARSAGESSMPIAVLKRKAGELPFEFTLSDANAMMPGRGLSSVPSIVITAKISSTGDALATAPGIGAVSAPIDTGNPVAVDLVIGPEADVDGNQ
jgi:Tetratricopeptide repeat